MSSDKKNSGMQAAIVGVTASSLDARLWLFILGLLHLIIALACSGTLMASATPPLQEVVGKPSDTPAPRNIQFTRITLREGLSQAAVTTIAQDRYGMIWLGTQEGLNRYDGYEMVVYEHLPGQPDTLSHDWVWSVYPDSSGTLWVGTDGGGLNRYNRSEDKFTHYRHDPQDPLSLSNDRVRVIYQDAQGTLWIVVKAITVIPFARRQLAHVITVVASTFA